MIQVCNSGLSPPLVFTCFGSRQSGIKQLKPGPIIKLPRIAVISYFGLNSSIVEVMEPPNNIEIWGGLD